MISRSHKAILLSFAVGSLCVSAQAETKQNIKSSLQALYTFRDAAFVNKDTKGTLSPYASNVVIISPDEEQSKGLASQQKSLTKLFASGRKFTAASTEITELVANKTGREVTTEVTRHITVDAASAPGNPSTADEVVRDHWVHANTGWQITQERRLTKETLLELLSPPSQNKIVGKWVGYIPSASGQPTQFLVEFKADGTETQAITDARQNISINATYIAQDGVLTETEVSAIKNGRVAPGGGGVQRLHYRFDGDAFLLSLPGASTELRFTKQSE